ncbi:TPA: hypothetical protein I7730_01085 [Vibrio vulnificus]|uniref:Uncharacterized protein n=1 Tax=Vibrio vulnificus TaxID=672 RepID=A0A8H9MYC9_VIBVL|nr:hypothetical protein [Vibrio vulnificus]HAS8538393.1 hypothetical protein [Vibrio vulnificus]
MGRTMLLGVLRMPQQLLTDNDPLDKIQRHSRYLEAANLIEEQDQNIEKLEGKVRLQEEELIRLSSVEAEFLKMIASMKDKIKHGHYSSQTLNALLTTIPAKLTSDIVTNSGLNQDELLDDNIRKGVDSKPQEGFGPEGWDKGLSECDFGPSVDSPTGTKRFEVFSEEEFQRNTALESAKAENQSSDSGENEPTSIRASWGAEVSLGDSESSSDDSCSDSSACSE